MTERLEGQRGLLLRAPAVLVLLTMTIAQMANAQETSAPATDDVALEEVLVTAQKRSQNLQKVGISITALSAADVAELQIVRSEDIAAHSPNVAVKNVYGNSFPIITIRGVGFNIFQANQSSAAAVHVDEVYLGSPALLGFNLHDIERIEVLKGPQGTLYGRNTTAGNINYVTRRPSDVFDALLKVGYGRFDEMRSEVMVNGPLASNLNGRLSGVYTRGDGWIDNALAGESGAGADVLAMRGQLQWTPSDDKSVLLRAHAGRDRSRISYYKPVGNVCPPGDEPNPQTCTDLLGYADPDSDPWSVRSNLSGRYDNPAHGASVTFNWELPWAQLTSIGAYDRFERRYADDIDSSPANAVQQNYDESFRQFSQEIRLASLPDAAINWIVGAYFAQDRVQLFRDADISDLAFLLDAPAPFVFLMNADQTTDAQAVFGQTEWPLAERWKLTAGARFTRESKDFDYENQLLIGGPPLAPNTSARGLEESWNDLSGRLGLDFAVSDDVLLYASVSKGFKSGGFPAGTTLSTEQVVPYDPEELVAYEIGMKSMLAARRVRFNAAAFYYDYRDKQEFAYVPASVPGAPPSQVLTNAGKARLYGAEAEMVWQATERLQLTAGLGLLEAELREFRSALLSDAEVVGNRLPNAPETTVNARVRYALPLANGSAVVFSGDASYEGGVYFDIQNDPYRREDSYVVSNASVTWTSADDLWEAGLWGRNLGNTAYKVDSQDFSFGFRIDTYAPPRTYGLTISRRWR